MQKETALTSAKSLGIPSFIVAAIFLFNPCVNVVDILPDFFGYLFLLRGMNKLADLSPAMADARDNFAKLRWFMLAKLISMAFVAPVDDTYVLIFTFGFAVIEAIYLFPAIGQLFAGLEYLATRHSCRAIYRNMQNVTTITYIFVAVKRIFVVLPELCSLSDYEYDGFVTAGVQIDFARYKPGLIIFGIFISLVIGIIWLSFVIPYISRISRETEFTDKLLADYNEKIASNTGLLFSRALHSSLMMFSAAGIFLLRVWFSTETTGGMNFVPGFVFGILLTIMVCILRKYADGAKPALIAAIVSSVLSLISFGISTYFSGIFYLNDIFYDFEAYNVYTLTKIAVLFEYVGIAAAMFFVYRMLRGIVSREYGAGDISDNRLVTIYTSQERELSSRFAATFALFAVSAAASLVFQLFRAELTAELTEAWLIPLILTVIWYAYQRGTLDTLDSQITQKYM